LGDPEERTHRTNRTLNERRIKTAYGRRVTSKTFTILGASTPNHPLSITLAPRKQEPIANAPDITTRLAVVSKMHNSALSAAGLIARLADNYVSGNKVDIE
jgi:hypothetical protein